MGEIKQSSGVEVKGAALMTDEERTGRFCSQMKCEEPRGHKLSFTAPHFKCCFLSFHWNLAAFFGALLHTHSQVGSFFLCVWRFNPFAPRLPLQTPLQQDRMQM